MEDKSQPVKIYCPISNIDEYVFFKPVEKEGKLFFAFNGCDHQYSGCEQCADCKQAAFHLLMNSLK